MNGEQVFPLLYVQPTKWEHLLDLLALAKSLALAHSHTLLISIENTKYFRTKLHRAVPTIF